MVSDFYLLYFKLVVKCFVLFIVGWGSWASFSSRHSLIVKSSGCKLDALNLSYALICPSTLSSMLTLLRLVSSHLVLSSYYVYGFVLFEEGDGRCVRASWPCSIKHSTLDLLLNPPLVPSFHRSFRSGGLCSCSRKCSPFLPSP